MPMTRQQLRRQAEIARYKAAKAKPPTRRQAIAWLAPIRAALAELRTGEVDSLRGYAVTRIHWTDNDFARIDHAMNGFTALIQRVMPDVDIAPATRLSKRLETGVLLTLEDLDSASALLNRVEDRLTTIPRATLIDAANTEMIAIELERMGLKEAA